MDKRSTLWRLSKPYWNRPMTSVWLYWATEPPPYHGADSAQRNSWCGDVSAQQYLKLTNNFFSPGLPSPCFERKMSSSRSSRRKTMIVGIEYVSFPPSRITNLYWFEQGQNYKWNSYLPSNNLKVLHCQHPWRIDMQKQVAPDCRTNWPADQRSTNSRKASYSGKKSYRDQIRNWNFSPSSSKTFLTQEGRCSMTD